MRVLGAPSTRASASRFGLPSAVFAEHLLDVRAYGWVMRHDYLGETWSLTDRVRGKKERQLAIELELHGVREAIVEGHRRFRALNTLHGVAHELALAWMQLHKDLLASLHLVRGQDD
ncbi:hypothetical protein [Micropruina sp.]|uniref:hypothetical protein n=1 Tax=Micropruina sp. TaxID=2737536 RepID=UPI0039E33A6C